MNVYIIVSINNVLIIGVIVIVCVVIVNIKYNTIGKIFVCETDRTRYFRTYAMSESEDVFYEIGYSPNLLINESLETMKELVLSEELIEATEEQENSVKDESRWL